MAVDLVPVRTALISVSEKAGLVHFVKDLYNTNPELTIISSGGTARALRDGLDAPYSDRVVDVSRYTGFPESPGDLVKTLHPRVHGGLLLDWGNSEHLAYMLENGIIEIDMAVLNLYPFSDVVAKPDATPVKAREMIDIGGPAMVRAAAKNFPRVAVVTDPNNYANVLNELDKNEDATSFGFRQDCRTAAFETTLEYERGIVEYYRSIDKEAERKAFGVEVGSD